MKKRLNASLFCCVAADENQLEDARLGMERYIMSRIYVHAVFPNGDGDIHRDQ